MELRARPVALPAEWRPCSAARAPTSATLLTCGVHGVLPTTTATTRVLIKFVRHAHQGPGGPQCATTPSSGHGRQNDSGDWPGCGPILKKRKFAIHMGGGKLRVEHTGAIANGCVLSRVCTAAAADVVRVRLAGGCARSWVCTAAADVSAEEATCLSLPIFSWVCHGLRNGNRDERLELQARSQT